MQINGPGNIHATQAVSAPHYSQTARPAETSYRAPQVDQLDISPEAEFISQTRNIPDIRADRVAAIRAEINHGTYETAEKLEEALDRLLDEIG